MTDTATWWEERGFKSPVDYWVEFSPQVKDQPSYPFVRLAIANMLDADGIPRVRNLKGCRSCGKMILDIAAICPCCKGTP